MPAVPAINGSYAIVIDVPGQSIPATLRFNQSGSVLLGSIAIEGVGSSEIKDGKVTNDGFSFGASVTFNGAPIDISVSGKVNGNQISGTVQSPLGDVPFSGTKTP